MKKNRKHTLEEIWNARRLLEEEYEYRKWAKDIPFIQLPDGYQFKPIANFGGSVVRFLASKDGERSVSIYLDCYEELGLLSFDDEPISYWEMYPTQDGDVFRCRMEETDKLVKAIVDALERGDGNEE